MTYPKLVDFLDKMLKENGGQWLVGDTVSYPLKMIINSTTLQKQLRNRRSQEHIGNMFGTS